VWLLLKLLLYAQGKLQGVETPSQKRYVYQFEMLVMKQKKYFTSPGDKLLALPTPKKIRLKSLVLRNLFSQPANLAKDGPLVCVVKVNNAVVFTSAPILHELLTNNPVFGLEDVEVEGDVCVGVYQAEKMAKGGGEAVTKMGKEKGSLFMFFFHSTFTSGGAMDVGMKMLDKAVKNKPVGAVRKPYNVEGGVKLVFQ